MKKREIALGFIILLFGLLLMGVTVRLFVVMLQYLFFIR